jgi:hypothetical protein
MTRFELLIELNGERRWLDTYNTEPISLTYNVADIIDIDKVNSSYSKTIKLPETKNNREIFGDISDLGVSATFNPNKKTRAWILVDTAMIFEGHLQLRKVIVDKDEDKREYEIVIYADNDNFFKQLGEKFLTDLDFSELNHNWTANNIRQSWTASWDKGYFYPLIDYGYNWNLGSINGWTTTYNTQVKTTQMYPSTNVKYIWNKIFNDAGYSYQSDFLNDEVFESLYIPFNKKEIVRNVNSISDKFSIGRTQSATFSANIPSPDPSSWPSIYNNDIYIIPDFFDVVDIYTNQILGQQAQDRQVQLTKTRVPFNNEAPPDGDPDNLYNTTLYEYTAPINFVSGRFVCDFDITFNLLTNYNKNKQGGTLPSTSICFRRSRNPATGATVSGGVVIPVNGSTAPLKFLTSQIPGLQSGLGGKRVSGQITTDILDDSTTNRKKLYPGEKVFVEVEFGINSKTLRQQVGNANLLSPTEVAGGITYKTRYLNGSQVGTFSQSNKFFNILTDNVLVNEEIDYTQVLPTNFKQKDFITSIVKMFNLIVEPSKQIERTLIIEPRDAYYAAGRVKDWTRKLNINEPIEEQILAETQNRQTNFRYKDDKDIYNEDYKNNRGGLAYGEYQYFIDNDFITGQKKVEIQFSPTPLIPLEGSVQFVIPVIAKVENNVLSRTEHNPRILTRFNSSTKSTWVYSDYQFQSGGPYNAYTKLTTTGFTNLIHPNYQVGDWISINQSDGGVLKPMLQGQFKILQIVDTRTIVINIPFSSVGSGAAVSGTITPLNGLLPTASDNDTWQFEGVRYKAYPYLGHFDNPQQPSYDLNWGQTTGLYYPEDTVTNNNLFTSYWENTTNEISDRDSRIITASFYLSPFDIADFRFSDNIFINNQYYKVNKILNYDPTKEALVKVELIKSIYITIQRPFKRLIAQRAKDTIAVLSTGTGKPSTTTGVIASGKDIVLGRPLGKPGILSGALKTNTTNLTTKSDVIVSGRDNQVFASNVIVSGSSNIVSSDKNFIQGDNNKVSAGSENNFLLGSNNTISPDVKNSFVIGDNQILETSNEFLINAIIIQSVDEVSASRNEVLNPFSSKVPNYISASRNSVREQGSYDTVSYISGGRYNIEE